MNYNEMEGKQGANMLNHVTTLAGQDQLNFFPLLIKNDYCVFRYRDYVKGHITHDKW